MATLEEVVQVKDYWARIERRVLLIWRSGDSFSCIRKYTQPGGQCELCDHIPITLHHVLRNDRSGERITVGSECVCNIHEVIQKLGSDVVIRYPVEYQRAAALINEKRPGTVLVASYDPAQYCDEGDEGASGDQPTWQLQDDADERDLLLRELEEDREAWARSSEDGWYYADDDDKDNE